MKPVNEGSSRGFTMRFYDRSGQEATPSTVAWTLTDVASGRVLQDWTSAVPALGTTIEVAAGLNVVIDKRKMLEEHCLTVKADAGLPSQYTEELLFKVKNLKAVK